MSEQELDTGIDLFDAILDAGWDDIPDLPDFVTLPNGMFKVLCEDVKVNPAKGDKRAYIVLRFSVVSTLELGEGTPEAVALEVPTGSLFSQNFQDQEGKPGSAVSSLKKVFGDVGTALGASTPRALLDQLVGTELIVLNKLRADTKKEGMWYNTIKMATLA